MSKAFRRFELLLPLRFNVFRDDLCRVFVDVPDTKKTRGFFVDFKERMKVRFKQIDIWMTTYRVEVL